MLEWLKRKNEKYTCAEVQNEMLQIMSLSILRDISQDIRNSVYYSTMADETTDVSNREQLVLVLRHVHDDLVAHEDFIGLYKVDSINSNTLTKTIEDCLLRMNLSLNNCRGQCDDGASNMSGAKNSVAMQISDKEARAVYTHTNTANTHKVDWVSQAKMISKCIRIASRGILNSKIFWGAVPPNAPLREGGNPPSRPLPPLVPSALGEPLPFHGRTTFQEPTAALKAITKPEGFL